MLGRILTRVFRVKAKSVLVAAVAGILGGLLSEWLTGRLVWSVGAGLLLVLCALAGSRTVLVASLHAERDLYRARRDIYTARTMHVAVGTVKNITRRSSLGSTVTALTAVILALWGTLYFGTRPGGRMEGTLPVIPGVNLSSTSWKTAATFQESDSGGDSIKQTVSFGDHVSLSSLPDVSTAAQSGACYSVPFPPSSRDLVIPFRIISTLESRVPDNAPVSIDTGTFSDSNYNSDGLGYVDYGGAAAYPLSLVELGGDIKCDMVMEMGSSDPLTVSLSSENDPAETYGWLVFPDAVDANDPNGNLEALGQTYAQLDFGYSEASSISIEVTGPGVCDSSSTTNGVGNFQGMFNNFPPYLHLGGPVSSWEQCTRRFEGNPTY